MKTRKIKFLPLIFVLEVLAESLKLFQLGDMVWSTTFLLQFIYNINLKHVLEECVLLFFVVVFYDFQTNFFFLTNYFFLIIVYDKIKSFIHCLLFSRLSQHVGILYFVLPRNVGHDTILVNFPFVIVFDSPINFMVKELVVFSTLFFDVFFYEVEIA